MPRLSASSPQFEIELEFGDHDPVFVTSPNQSLCPNYVVLELDEMGGKNG